jgi:osmoprotectant transport system permease protein
MFDGIVEALVNRLAPLLTGVGDGVCKFTPGLVNRWPVYEFMCRNTEDLAVLTIEHVAVTLIAMAIAILLGVLIGVRVSSAPWPQRGTIWFWPVVGLVIGFVLVGIIGLIVAPDEVAAVEAFKPPNVSTWGWLLSAEGVGLLGVFVLIQAVIVLALGATFASGMLPAGDNWWAFGAAVLGAIILPLVVPPLLLIILKQVIRLLASLPLSSEALRGIARTLEWVRNAGPLWALIVFVLMLGKLSKRLTWQTLVAAAFGGYAIPALLGIFTLRPGTEASMMVIQLILFAIFALIILLGERAADPTLYVVAIIFTIPSLAMFGIMIPLIGIGVDPAVVALVLYGLLPILRNTITGMRELDPAYIEAGRGMGMTDLQLLTRVRLPLTLPVILAGVKVSTVMTVGIASVATLIGAGGLGELIFHGINRTQPKMVLTGAIWIAALALAFDFFLGQSETRWVSKGIRPDKATPATQETVGV